MKRHQEGRAGEEARPSEDARLRLRRAVADTFAAPEPSLWRRPVALRRAAPWLGVALVIAVAVGRETASGPSRHLSRASLSLRGLSVDTARERAESLDLY
jgi:hypothetical protein